MTLRCAPVSTAIFTCVPQMKMVIIGMKDDSQPLTTLSVALQGELVCSSPLASPYQLCCSCSSRCAWTLPIDAGPY